MEGKVIKSRPWPEHLLLVPLRSPFYHLLDGGPLDGRLQFVLQRARHLLRFIHTQEGTFQNVRVPAVYLQDRRDRLGRQVHLKKHNGVDPLISESALKFE